MQNRELFVNELVRKLTSSPRHQFTTYFVTL
jgi:hypothetical protein